MNGYFLLSTAAPSNLNGILLIVAMLAIIGFVVNMNIKFIKKLNALAPDLLNNPDAYIQGMEALSKRFVPKGYKEMLRINIAIANMQKADYPAALDTLKRISPRRMQKGSVGVYYLVLANVQIQLGDNKSALTLIQTHDKKLNKLPMSGNLPMLNALATAFYAMETDNWDSAKNVLDYAKENWTEPMPGVNFDILYRRMEAHLSEHPLEAIEEIAEEA